VESTVLEAALLSDSADRLPYDPLVQDQRMLEASPSLENRSPLILSFSNPIHWVAIAIALRQMTQISSTTPIIYSIEAPTAEETILSVSIAPQSLSIEEFKSTLMQRYEALRLTFAPLSNLESESISENSILKDGALNQLLNLVISNLI
jgi:hypothetical protein